MDKILEAFKVWMIADDHYTKKYREIFDQGSSVEIEYRLASERHNVDDAMRALDSAMGIYVDERVDEKVKAILNVIQNPAS